MRDMIQKDAPRRKEAKNEKIRETRVLCATLCANCGRRGGGGKIAYGGATSPLLDAEKLKYELRVLTPAQGAYVDDVVDKVKKGQLPIKILSAAYQYAMRREVGRRPLYFKICIEQLAKKAGLKLSFLSF